MEEIYFTRELCRLNSNMFKYAIKQQSAHGLRQGAIFGLNRGIRLLSTSTIRCQEKVVTEAEVPKKGKVPYTVNVELPDVMKNRYTQRKMFIGFCILMGVSFYGIIKYEDASAPVVSSTLYTLRRSKQARAILGENIGFASLMPWISGSVAAGAGTVDFSYRAKGEKGAATVRFNSRKDPLTKKFIVLEWSLTPDNGETVSLLEEDYHPFVPGPKEEPTRRLAH